MAWHREVLFFCFPSLFFIRFRNLFANICGKCAKKCLKKVAFLAHLRCTCSWGRKNTRFQHDSREDGHENDARSVPYLEPAPSVELWNRGAHRFRFIGWAGVPITSPRSMHEWGGTVMMLRAKLELVWMPSSDSSKFLHESLYRPDLDFPIVVSEGNLASIMWQGNWIWWIFIIIWIGTLTVDC